MSESAQSFETHAKIVPLYHRWMTGLLVLPTLYFGYRTVLDFSMDRLALLLFAVGVVLAALFARIFPLGVQDRVIRLEERLRLERLLPPDLESRIPDLTTSQLVALRFASDEELPDLVRRVLTEGITDRTEIKRAIKTWRPDHARI
jgi:uncharacterized membrane protein YciS (DUF1049 family)